jgi:phosphoribosylanthranilate isomerase
VSRLWIKICGMRTPGAIEAAAESGADAVGFVFHTGSPRNVSAEEARALRRVVPESLERVAVFLHPSQALLDAAIDALAPHWVQVDSADLASRRLPQGQRVLPVLRSGGTRPDPLPSRCLFESGRSGAGEVADWDEARCIATGTEVVLAGGLDARNVGDAVRAVRPFGVDVSSGVESSRGVKDVARIREFIRVARAAEPLPVREEIRR